MNTKRTRSLVFRLTAACIILLSVMTARAQDVFLPCPGGLMDSSQAIEDGLMATKEGDTLHLGACTYYLTRTVVADWNHHGTMQGQGKEATFIEIYPGAKIDGVPISHANGVFSFSTLFHFDNPESGDITISDLAILVTDPKPAGAQDEDWYWNGALYNLIVVTGEEVNTTFDDVLFRGASGDFIGFYDPTSPGFNVAHGSHIFGSPQMTGSVTVRNSDFIDMFITVNPYSFYKGAIDISNNSFSNVQYGPWVEACSDCTVNISRNDMEDIYGAGVLLDHFDQYFRMILEPSEYLVHKNTISLGSIDLYGYMADGVRLKGPREDGPLSPCVSPNLEGAVVSQNKIFSPPFSDDELSGRVGIFAECAVDVLVSNNRVEGGGFAGIWAEDSATWTLLGNNLQNFHHFKTAPIGIFYSYGFRVVGGNNSENVATYAGGQHIFTGVNNAHYSELGQDIKEALERRKENRKSMP